MAADFTPDDQLDGDADYGGFEPDDPMIQAAADVVDERLAQHASQQQESPEAAMQAYVAEVTERHPDLATPKGAQSAVDLAGHVAQSIGRPDLAGELGFIEAVHAAAEGARAGVGTPPPDLKAQILGTDGGRRGGSVLPWS